jgi:hypothetical protein
VSAVPEGRRQETDPSAPLVMRAGPGMYVVCAVVFGLLLGLVFSPLLQGRPILLRSGQKILLEGWPAACAIAVLPVGLAAVFIAWTRAFRVEIREGRLSYTTLFTGTRSIALSDIQSARYCVGRRRRRNDPIVRLEIAPRPGSGAPSVTINIKFLRRRDVVRLLERLHIEDGPSQFFRS